MPGTGERAYAYAKACGIISKSFVNKRAGLLSNIDRLSDLDRLIFPAGSRALPEKELVKDIEKRINKRSKDAIIAVVNSFKKPPEFLKLLIRGWEFEDIKNALNTLSELNSGTQHGREIKKIGFTDLGRFGTVNFSAWPDIEKMLKKTEFEYLLNLMGKGSFFIQEELDRHYYNSLWKALCRLAKNDRKVSQKILAEEISLRNCVCALRLRTYYLLDRDEVKPHLIGINKVKNGSPLAADALVSLDFPLDNREIWTGWKREKFLNPAPGFQKFEGRQEIGGDVPWKADPRYFQNKAALYLFRLAEKSFRFRLSSLDSIFCFIKVKQFEEELIMSHVEGISLGLSSGEVLSMLGVE